MKIVTLKELNQYSTKFDRIHSLSEDLTPKLVYDDLVLNINRIGGAVRIIGEGFEKTFVEEDVVSAFDTGKNLVFNLADGTILAFSKRTEAGGKGIKVLPANQAPKDPEDRKKKRAQYIAQGYDGVRYEGEEEPDEDDKEGQDLVDNFEESQLGPSQDFNGEIVGHSERAAIRQILGASGHLGIVPLRSPGSNDYYLKIMTGHEKGVIVQILGLDGE